MSPSIWRSESGSSDLLGSVASFGHGAMPSTLPRSAKGASLDSRKMSLSSQSNSGSRPDPRPKFLIDINALAVML